MREQGMPLNLPKNLKDHPRLEEITQRFTDAMDPLWPGGKILVARWAFDSVLREALRLPFGKSHLVQGLELITSNLANEQKGLKMAKHAVPPTPRMSRLLLLTQDGSERFYRDAESLLVKHGDRLAACVLAVDSAELGSHVGAKGPVKALLIDDKTVLGEFLASL